MLLDEILDLPVKGQHGVLVRDQVARIMNEFYEAGDKSAFIVCGIFPFRSPGFRVTNSTEDLLKGLVLESINFPPFPYEAEAQEIETDADFRYYIIKGKEKFRAWKQCNG